MDLALPRRAGLPPLRGLDLPGAQTPAAIVLARIGPAQSAPALPGTALPAAGGGQDHLRTVTMSGGTWRSNRSSRARLQAVARVRASFGAARWTRIRDPAPAKPERN